MALFLGLAGLIILIVFLSHVSQELTRWLEVKRKEKNKRGRYKPHAERYSHIQQADERVVAARVHAIVNQLEAQQEQQERQEDGRALRDWLTISALVVAGFAAFASDVILYRQLQDARVVADTAHADSVVALIANSRPWVQPTSLEVHDFLIAGDEVIANVLVHYSNVGHSPAQNIGVNSTMSAGGASVMDALNECPKTIRTDALSGYAKSVFAGQPGGDWSNLHVRDIHRIMINGVAERYISLAVAGCLFYKFDGSRDLHYTTFLGLLARKAGHSAPGNEGGSGIDIMSNGPVSPSDLEMQIVDVGTSAN